MNTCQIQQTTKTLKFVPANNSSLKEVLVSFRDESKIVVRFICCFFGLLQF